jgi:AcrR family transcriptional regulator
MTRTDSLFFGDADPPSQRARMLDAITRAVAEKGHAHVTVADVVGLAGVSRRTFYEQFEDKGECLLAAATTGTGVLVENVGKAGRALGPEAGWQDVLRAAIDAYVGTLADHPEFARTFLVDIPGAGPKAVQLRREVYDRFVQLYAYLARRAAEEEPDLGEVPEVYLRALVGGAAELVHQHVLTNEPETLRELAPVLTQLVVAVIHGAAVQSPISR